MLSRTLPLALALLAASSAGCGGSDPVEAREPEVQSNAVEREYKDLRARFFASNPEGRELLEKPLRTFMTSRLFGPRVRNAGLLLAWIYIERGEFPEARRLIEKARKSAPSDFVTLTEAALVSRAGDPERALGLLEPLEGKMVDPDERLLCAEERVRSALAAGRNRAAIAAMIEWLVQAPAEQFDTVRGSVERQVSSLPTDDLMPALASLDESLASHTASTGLAAARAWLKKVLYVELEGRARKVSDASLARELLPRVPPALRGSAEFAALSRLASAGATVPHIAGRAIGLFLSVGSEGARRRSAAVSAGIARELARGTRKVELIVRDDAGSPERTVAALAALASDGAAILIAGVDDEAAKIAASFAESARIPVLLLRPPREGGERKFGFVAGEDDENVVRALQAELLERGRSRPVRVGAGGVACDSAAAFAGKSRFPVEEWKKQSNDAVIVLGDASCARDVASEVARTRLPALVACGLECAEVQPRSGTSLLTAWVGSFPAPPGEHGSVTWYEALGRDVAALSSAALADFPEQRVMDQAKVGELHERARRALEGAQVELWTSDQRGFAGGRSLARQIRVVDGAAVPRPKGAP